MKEKLRDKTRDELAGALNSLGVRAEMAERGRIEEKVNSSWYKRSLGVIDLPEGPIKWINIIKKDGGKDSPPRWWINLCIPDERPVLFDKEVKVRAVRKKYFPLFGKVINVTWRGEDCGTGLVHTLSNDESSKALATAIGNLEVRSCSKEFQGWTLQVDRRFSPTSPDWEAINKIAAHLLSSPRTP